MASKKPARTLNYNRTVGALYVTIGKKEFGYWVDRLPHYDARVVAVRLTKFQAARKADEPDHYDVTCGPQTRSCECLGFLRHGHCKHGDALAVLHERGMLS
jgi:hypothetical protein